MAETTNLAFRLHAEAARCERIALGMTDQRLVAQLTSWARDYRADAHRHASRRPD